MRARPVVWFTVVALVPWLVAAATALSVAPASTTTPPARYIGLLQREGPLDWTIETFSWKYFLARDPSCHRAGVFVFGSSRVRELGPPLLGRAGVCNLHVSGFNALQFPDLVSGLPPAGRPGLVAYVGLDHFAFWARSEVPAWPEAAQVSEALWSGWQLLTTLDQLSVAYVRRAWTHERKGQRPDRLPEILWHADGHGEYASHYARKRLGLDRPVSAREVASAVHLHFNALGPGHVRASHLRAFARGIGMLRAKGYEVRPFWTPLPTPYLLAARRNNGALFAQTLKAVGTMLGEAGVGAYPDPAMTLDASKLGCGEREFQDASHLDIDCWARFFGAVFKLDVGGAAQDSGRSAGGR